MTAASKVMEEAKTRRDDEPASSQGNALARTLARTAAIRALSDLGLLR